MRNNFFALMLLFTALGYSQFNHQKEISQMVQIPNSAEATAFTTYGNTSVNLFTGTPIISVPLYTIKGRELQVPMALTYDATGVKVTQLATQVGLGWNLQVGGRISRITNGQPDDYTNINGSPYLTIWDNTLQAYILDYRGNNNLWFDTKEDVEEYLTFIRDMGKGMYDTQPDYFSLNAIGINDYIVFDVETRVPKALNNPRIAVSYTKIGDKISKWHITNDDGTQYFFDLAELTRTTNYDDIDGNSNLYAWDKEFNSSWVLTKIISSNGKDVVEFNYEQQAQYWTNPQLADFGQVSSLNLSGGTGSGQSGNHITSTQSTAVNIKQQFLKSIVLNGDEIVNVTFGTRYDYTNSDYRVDKIEIRDIGTASLTDNIKTYKFNQSYFRTKQDYSDNVLPENTDFYKLRLKLDSVSIQSASNQTVEEFSFEYEDDGFHIDWLPELYSNSMDYLGYFNDRNNTAHTETNSMLVNINNPGGVLYPRYINQDYGLNLPGADRTSVFSHAVVGTLNKITYPTGGYTEYLYESDKEHITVYNTGYVNDVTLQSNLPTLTAANTDECGFYSPNGPMRPDFVSATFQVTSQVMGSHRTLFTSSGSSQAIAAIPRAFIIKIPTLNDTVTLDEFLNSDCTINENIEIAWQHDSSEGDENTFMLEEGYYQTILLNMSETTSTSLEVNHYQNVPQVQETDRAGIRVHRIKNYASDGVVATEKRYTYLNGRKAYDPNLVFFSQQEVMDPQTNTITVDNFIHRVASSSGGNRPHIVYDKVREAVLDANGNESNGYTDYTFNATNQWLYHTGVYTNMSISGGSTNVNNYGVKNAIGKIDEVKTYGKDATTGNAYLISESKQEYVEDLNTQYYVNHAVYIDINRSNAFKYPVIRYYPNRPGQKYTYQLVPGTYNSTGGSGSNFTGGDLGYYIDPPSDCSDGLNGILCTDETIASLILRDTYAFGRVGNVKQTNSKEYRNGLTIDQTVDYTYDDANTNVTDNTYLLKETQTTDSKGQTISSKVYYPHEMGSEYALLVAANKKAIPVKTEGYVNGQRTNTRVTKFSSQNLPEVIEVSKGTDALEPRVFFSRYDNKNVVEYAKERIEVTNGPFVGYEYKNTTALIWGYNDMYPIAKLEGVGYNDIPSNIITDLQTLSTSGTQAQLQAKFEELRAVTALSDALITTYVYKPLVGIISETDPRGYTVTYTYDDYNRLLYVKDANGNVLSKNDYNYAN